jgi:RimJ/RimL family protein N-acetyltransferase
MAKQSNPYTSARLIYRAVEEEADEPFLSSLFQDPAGQVNSSVSLHVPRSSSDTKKSVKWLKEECVCAVVICLPATSSAAGPGSDALKLTPIGIIHIDHSPTDKPHHRHGEIGIGIMAPYQRQGYGSEAIRWISRWAFMTAGYHRVSIAAAEYNEGAVRLYARLGFVEEGRWREVVFHEGKWWSIVLFSMIEHEWRALEQKEKEA